MRTSKSLQQDSVPVAEARELFAGGLDKQLRGDTGRRDEVLAAMGTPHPKQAEFLELVASQSKKCVLYGGARGGGKSWAFRRALVERAFEFPGSVGILLRRTFPDLRINHILKFMKELLPGSYGYSQQNHEFRFENGSLIVLGYCKTDSDVTRYLGQEYDTIAIDEITQWQELWLNWLMGSLRTTRPRVRPLLLTSGNPGNIGHVWVKRRWIDRQFEQNERADDYAFIPAKVYDNPSLTENDPDYVKTLESLPDTLRRAWLDGDWDIFAGQYFTELRREIHGFEGNAPMGWTFTTTDWGEKAPAATYWARVDHEGCIWIYRELYEPGHTWSERADKIVAMSVDQLGRPESIRYNLGGPDLWHTGPDTGVTGADVFAARGVPLVQADDDRVPGWMRMREFLRRQLLKVHVHACPNFWRTVPALIHDDHKPEDVDSDGEDHAGDAIRYALATRHVTAQLYGMPISEEEERLPEIETSPNRAGGYY